MAVGSVFVEAVVSRHISCKLLISPPVICFVWTALTPVVAHSLGKNEETSWRASVVLRRIGVRVSLAAMFVDVTFCFPSCEKDRVPTSCRATILLSRFRKTHAAE